MERHTRRNVMRLFFGGAAAAGIYGAGYYFGSQNADGNRTTPTTSAVRPPADTLTRPSAPLDSSPPSCTTIRNGEGVLSAASRSSGKGPVETVSVTSKATGISQTLTVDELQASDIVVHPGDTVCVDNRPPGPAVALRTPERRGERLTKNPTVFNQREYREGDYICGPTTFASIFTTFGISGMTPDVIREELRRLGLYSPADGTIFRNSSLPDDAVRWLKRKGFSVESLIDIQGKGHAPEFDTSDLRSLQRMCENDTALIASGMVKLPEIGDADHILWINDARPETEEIKVVDPWGGRYEWRKARAAFKPLFYVYAVKPR